MATQTPTDGAVLTKEDVARMPADRVREAYAKVRAFTWAQTILGRKYGEYSQDSDEYDTLYRILTDYDEQGLQVALQRFRGEVVPANFVSTYAVGEDVPAQVFEGFRRRDSLGSDDVALRRARARLTKIAATDTSPKVGILTAVVEDWMATVADDVDGHTPQTEGEMR